MKKHDEIPSLVGPFGRKITRTAAEDALRLADAIIEWAASVDPAKWGKLAQVWRDKVL